MERWTRDDQRLSRGATISDAEFRALAALVQALLGIRLPERRRSQLENRLCARLEALSLSSFSEYLACLQSPYGGPQELDLLIDQVTTNETQFFRDGRQLNVFVERLLRPLAARRAASGEQRLRLWSAGCSSGEEPYSLAMLVSELLGEDLAGWDVRITATDVCSKVLRQAASGVYARGSVQDAPPGVLGRYFLADGPRLEVDPAIRQLVRFERVNLNSVRDMGRVPRSDFIFCRNVIIFFDEAMKRRLAVAFHDNLADDGALLLGRSETLHGLTDALVPVDDLEEPVYRRREARQG